MDLDIGLALTKQQHYVATACPQNGQLLRVKASENVTQGGATGFTATDKCRLVGDAIDPGTADFWVEFWFSADTVTATGNRGIVGTGAGGVGEKGFSVYQVNNALGFILSDGTGTALGAVASGIAASTPYHVVCCFDRDDKMTPYVNGAAGTPVDISTCQLTLGSDWSATVLGAINATEFFGGALQCVRVGIGSLPTAAEIADLYNGKNPLTYAELPGAIVAKLGDDGASWDLNESLIDPTHQALDSHGTNHLTFTPATFAANGAFAANITNWEEHESYKWDVACEWDAGGKLHVQSSGDTSPSYGLVSQTFTPLTAGHVYRIKYDLTRTIGALTCLVCDAPGGAVKGYGDYDRLANASVDTTFTAVAGATCIEFYSLNSAPANWLIDNVELYATRLYPANGFQTAIASDVSGNGNHATLTGFSTTQAVEAWQPRGATGHALTFDGVAPGNRLITGTIAHGIGTGDFTYSALVKISTDDVHATSNLHSVITNGSVYTPAFGVGTGATGAAVDGNVAMYFDGWRDFGAGITKGTWQHIAVTRTSGVLTGYVAGAACPNTFSVATSIADAAQIIGASHPSGGDALRGSIADVREYNVALTALQISQLLTLAEDEELAGLTPVAHWTFGDGPSYTVADGDPVLAIDSCEGNRRRFVQDNILKRPLWIASGMNGKPVLRFDGVDDYLAYVGAALSGDVGTVVAFLQLSSAPNAAQTLLSQADTAGDTRFLGLYARLDTATPNIQYSQNDAGTADALTGSTEIAATTVYCLVWDTGGSGGIIRAFVNGVAQTLTEASGANNGDWWADITGADVTALGALVRSAATLCGAIDLAELIVYDRVLSDAELARVLRYGVRQYGVSP